LIKVLHIITRLDMGGSAQNTLDTCLWLNPERYAVTLMHGLARESDMTTAEQAQVREKVARARQRGVDVIPIASLERRINLFKDLCAFFLILHYIRRENPIIVHTHTSKAGFLGRVAAWLSRVPIVIQTPHGHVFFGHFNPAGSKFFLLLERIAARITHRLVALTDRERMDYVRLGVAPARKLVTIHSGVDIARFGIEQSDGWPARKGTNGFGDAVVIGYVGWLLPVKGVMALVKAMKVICDSCPDAKLMLAGKGGQEAELRIAAQRLGIGDNVVFCGWSDRIEELLPLFDMLVLPSLNEGMGRVLVEAMAAGLPIVASDAGGIPDLVQDGKNGILFPPGDAQALADGILSLIRRPDEARRMGNAGRQMSRHFSVEAMVAKIEQLYDGLAGKISDRCLQPLSRQLSP